VVPWQGPKLDRKPQRRSGRHLSWAPFLCQLEASLLLMLTDQQKAMIDLAGEHFKHAGSLDTAAMERFGMSPTRYWQGMNRLIRTEAAVAYRPQTVALLSTRRQAPTRTASRLSQAR